MRPQRTEVKRRTITVHFRHMVVQEANDDYNINISGTVIPHDLVVRAELSASGACLLERRRGEPSEFPRFDILYFHETAEFDPKLVVPSNAPVKDLHVRVSYQSHGPSYRLISTLIPIWDIEKIEIEEHVSAEIIFRN